MVAYKYYIIYYKYSEMNMIWNINALKQKKEIQKLRKNKEMTEICK